MRYVPASHSRGISFSDGPKQSSNHVFWFMGRGIAMAPVAVARAGGSGWNNKGATATGWLVRLVLPCNAGAAGLVVMPFFFCWRGKITRILGAVGREGAGKGGVLVSEVRGVSRPRAGEIVVLAGLNEEFSEELLV